MSDERLLTQREVCDILRVSPKTLQLLRRNLRLPFVRFGYRSIRIRQSDVEKFLKRSA